MTKAGGLLGALGVASVVLMGDVGTARAKDAWFVLAEQTIKTADPSVKITAEDAKWIKEDIKQVKISAEGGDVDVQKVILHWNNRPDDTVWNVGIIKSGGQTAPKDAPGHEATLGSVSIQYKILNDAPTAKLKIWGFD